MNILAIFCKITSMSFTIPLFVIEDHVYCHDVLQDIEATRREIQDIFITIEFLNGKRGTIIPEPYSETDVIGSLPQNLNFLRNDNS